jgi:hypothetical protein
MVSNHNAMYMTTEVLDPRFFWPMLPLLSKLYILFLCVVSIYVLFSELRILLRLRAVRKLGSSNDPHSALNALAALRRADTNIHELIVFTFFLFGLIFVLQIPAAFMTLDNSRTPGWVLIFKNLATYYAFAADVFFALLLLHSAQWFVSARLNSAEIRLTLPH